MTTQKVNRLKSVRFLPDEEKEIEKIAGEEVRNFAQTVRYLVRLGIEARCERKTKTA